MGDPNRTLGWPQATEGGWVSAPSTTTWRLGPCGKSRQRTLSSLSGGPMGCCLPKDKIHVIHGSRVAAYDPSFNTDNDLKVKIPKKFAELDADGSGELDYDEFCQGFGFDKTPLTHKLFDAFDQDCSGNINIVEFIAGLRNWQRFSYSDKMKFTYKIYDLDGSGYVEPPELAECLADTNAA